MAAFVDWLKGTSLSQAMSMSPVLWPVCEMLHFIGLALLIGSAGLIDLRLMGAMQSVPLRAVMQVRKWAVLGIVINVIFAKEGIKALPEVSQILLPNE